MATYTKRLFRGSMSLFVMSSVAALIAYFIRIITARNLTPSEYGLFYSVFAFVSFFLFFRDMGTNQALSKFIAEFKANQNYQKIKNTIVSVFIWQLISSIIFGILLFVFSDFLGKYYFKNSFASPMLHVFILYVLFSMIVLFLSSIFQGHQKMLLFALPDPLTNLFTLIGLIIFFNLGIKVMAPAYALTLSWFVVLLVLIFFFIRLFKKYAKYSFKFTNFKDTSIKLFAFSLPIMLTGIGAKVISRIDTIMLTYFTTLDKVGIYNVVMPTALLFLFFADSVAAAVFPMISELWAKKDMSRLKDWLRVVYKYSFVIVIPAFLALFTFPDLFIRLFFGQNYVSGAQTLQILLVGVLFFTIARLSTTTLVGIGQPAKVTKLILFASLLNIAANLVLIPLFGMEGAAYATVISYFFMFIMSSVETTRFIKVKLPVASWIKTFVAASIFIFAVEFLKKVLVMNVWLEMIVTLTTATLVYVAVLFILKIIDFDEIKKYVGLAI